MKEQTNSNPAEKWAQFRFSIVGPLLSSPPEHGMLGAELKKLSQKYWKHPTEDKLVQFGQSTIERWYYDALHNPADPVGALKKKVRSDAGTIDINPQLAKELKNQYKRYSEWSYLLHTENLAALVRNKSDLGPMPSYSKVKRYMQRNGLEKKKRPKGKKAHVVHKQEYETRSFESLYVGGLWHLDFHHGSQKVLAKNGQWCTPIALGIFDDRSRIACHVQWYFQETAENLVHGIEQAFQKWGLPRLQMTDNGSAMISAEFVRGLSNLGIVHDTTLPYCPYQNGKAESFWGLLEGRLVAMLKHVKVPTLYFYNKVTQAWVDQGYNRRFHSEIGKKPLHKYLDDKSVTRDCPPSADLHKAFRMKTVRTQRKSDGTISIEGTRFEIPGRYRHIKHLTVCYARWNLQLVHLLDSRTDKCICRIYPLDKEANADRRRRKIPQEPAAEFEERPQEELPPYMIEMLDKYESSGKPPGYLSKPSDEKEENDEKQ